MLDALDEIGVFTSGMDRESFLADEKTQKAVYYNLATIGEAVVHIPQEVRDLAEEIPWRLIVDTRNFFVHAYFRVDAQRVWDTVVHDLPKLSGQLGRLLKSHASEDS